MEPEQHSSALSAGFGGRSGRRAGPRDAAAATRVIQSGVCVSRVWLAVGRKEQLKRLEARRKDPLKQCEGQAQV